MHFNQHKETIKMKTYHKIARSLGSKKTYRIMDLIRNLEWDFDRMSSSGQETYKQLLDELDLENFDE
jgi:hypothetical protein